jgi:uncharacterized protein YndB with AHSA1/START domain
MMSQAIATDSEVLIARTIKAPREKVFDAWTEQEQLIKWFAPTGCTISYKQLEAAQGGHYISCVHVPDGKECWCKGAYLELNRPNCLVFSMVVCDEQGREITAIDAGMDPEWPDETIVTVTFEDIAGNTRLTLHQTVSESLAKRTGAYPSWLIMLDNLEALMK